MAVNLETLLPQAYSQATPPVVPSSNGSEESQFGDLFSPNSMYGNPLEFDPALLKSDYLSSLGEGVMDMSGALYQTNPSDPFTDWMTTPMSLPITPDEPLGDNLAASSLPPVYAPIQTFPNHTPSPSVPLTPESLVSPESFCSSDEVDEVLSYFSSDSVTPLEASDAFNVFPSPSTSAEYSATNIYNDNYSSSLNSPYTSLASSPTSPLSSVSSPTSTLYATPLTNSLASSPHPPTSLTLHPIAPGDTIRDLLTQSHPSINESTPLNSAISLQDNYQLIQHTNLQKRKCRLPESDPGEPVSKKAAKGYRKRRVSTSTKKERKRDQNKTAALRYRQKKKFEKIDYVAQQLELEEKNSELQATLNGLEAEISYLTQLWSEVERAKRQRSQQ